MKTNIDSFRKLLKRRLSYLGIVDLAKLSRRHSVFVRGMRLRKTIYHMVWFISSIIVIAQYTHFLSYPQLFVIIKITITIFLCLNKQFALQINKFFCYNS